MSSNENPVVVSGVDIPFADLVTLLLKLALASIPAGIILGILGFFVGLALTMVFGGLGAMLR